MKTLYEVTAINSRRIKGATGYFTAEQDYVVYHCYQEADSPDSAIDLVKTYYMPRSVKYTSMRACEV